MAAPEIATSVAQNIALRELTRVRAALQRAIVKGDEERRKRDELIRFLVAHGKTRAEISRVVELSRMQVGHIVKQGS